MTRTARSAILALWFAVALAGLAPLLVWLDADLIALAVLPDARLGGQPPMVTPLARLLGVAATLPSCLLVAWGLLGLLPVLRAIGAGIPPATMTGARLRRLGLAVLLIGVTEPLGRAALRLALSLGQGEIAIALGLSAGGVLLIALGVAMMALGGLVRDAAAALEENAEFV